MPPEPAAPAPRDPWDDLEAGSVDGSTPPAGASQDRGTALAIEEPQRYRSTALLGRGGMGQVWAAEDRRLRRSVALKRATPSSHAAQRLKREAEICAQLEHPNIVPIYDAGLDEHGEPWYAMRLVRGRTLQQRLDLARGHSERLELLRPMLAVCQAVGYAHQHGVVHRDLKPANVMIGAHGEVQVLDWGLARRLGDEAQSDDAPCGDEPKDAPVDAAEPAEPSPGDAGLTSAGALLGTPRYMSPEAYNGEPIGPAGDVWSLGAMLHHIAYGEPPPLQPLQAAPELAVELQAMIAKALAIEPCQRYRDAADLADDLARWLDGKRVRAHAYTPGQLAGRLLRAWRGPLSVAAVALLLLLLLGALAIGRLATERDRARLAEASTRQALAQADTALTQALQGAALDAAADLALPEAEVLACAAPGAENDAQLRGVLAGLAAGNHGAVRSPLALPPCAVAAIRPDGAALYCWQQGQLSALALPSGAALWRIPLAAVQQVVAGQDRVAVLVHARDPRQALLIDATSGAVQQRVDLPAPLRLQAGRQRLVASNAGWLLQFPQGGGELLRVMHPCGEGQILSAVAVSAEDDTLVAACGEALWLADPATLALQPLRLAGPPAVEHGLTALALQRRGGLLVAGDARGRLGAADLSQGRWLRGLATAGGMVRELRLQPGGDQLLASVERGGALLWAPQTTALPQRLPSPHGATAGFAPDGQLITLGQSAARWQLRPAKAPVMDLVGRTGLTSVASRGAWLAGSAGDGSVVVVDAGDGGVLARLPGGGAVAKRASFSADGQLLAVASTGRPYLRLYRTSPWTPVASGDVDQMIRRAEFAKDRLIVTTPMAAGGPLALGVGADGRLLPPRWRSDEAYIDAAVGAGGRQAAWLAELDGRVIQASLDQQGPPQERLRLAGAVAIDVSGDGHTLAVASADSVWLHRRGQAKAERVGRCDGRLMDVALDPAGAVVAAASSQGTLYVWRLTDGKLVAELRGHQGHAVYVGFDDAGDLLSAGWDGTARRWHGATLRGAPLPSAAAAQQRWALSLAEAMARPR